MNRSQLRSKSKVSSKGRSASRRNTSRRNTSRRNASRRSSLRRKNASRKSNSRRSSLRRKNASRKNTSKKNRSRRSSVRRNSKKRANKNMRGGTVLPMEYFGGSSNSYHSAGSSALKPCPRQFARSHGVVHSDGKFAGPILHPKQ